MNCSLTKGVLALALIVGSFSSCAAEEEPENFGTWLHKTWGISIEGLDKLENVEMNEDGSSSATASGQITVDGLGSQDLEVFQQQYSLAEGGGLGILFVEPDTGDERFFYYNEVENWIGIGDEIAGAAVSKNNDGTYSVWTYVGEEEEDYLVVENGYEALLVIEEYNEFKDTSPFILLAAYVAALTPSGLEARIPAGQFGEGTPGVPMNAEGPGVCLIFSEFCECAACLVLDRKGECGQCPEL